MAKVKVHNEGEVEVWKEGEVVLGNEDEVYSRTEARTGLWRTLVRTTLPDGLPRYIPV